MLFCVKLCPEVVAIPKFIKNDTNAKFKRLVVNSNNNTYEEILIGTLSQCFWQQLFSKRFGLPVFFYESCLNNDIIGHCNSKVTANLV